jgi:hypothetical protein
MATFSKTWRDQLFIRMQDVGTSQQTIAALTGLPQNKLCQFFAGNCGLENQDLVKIYDLLVACEKLAAHVAPLPINWSKSAAVKASLEAFKNGELRSVLVGSASATT